MQWGSDKQGEEDYLSGRWKKGIWCSEDAVLLKWGLLTASAFPRGIFLEYRTYRSI